MSRKHFSAPFDAFLAAELPASSAAFKDVEFVSLDIETTGLDAANADVQFSLEIIARPAVIFCIEVICRDIDKTDTLVGDGLSWGVAMGMIVEILTGRVLLVHHAGLDKALLDRMCMNCYGARLPVPVVDTLALEHRRMQRKHHIEIKKALRLSDLRAEYNLPRYNAHDCLVDAIATAELLIAIAAHRGDTLLGELLE